VHDDIDADVPGCNLVLCHVWRRRKIVKLRMTTKAAMTDDKRMTYGRKMTTIARLTMRVEWRSTTLGKQPSQI
jgi:hypothetical protein